MSSLKNLKRHRQEEPESGSGKGGSAPELSVKVKKKPGIPYQNWLLPGSFGLVFLLIIGFAVKVFMSDAGGHKKEPYKVTLIKPPPPDEKIKPPEPEKLKEAPKESIPTPTEVSQPQAQNDQAPDNAPPAGADLGVAGEGGAGSDGFGLVGKGKGYKGRDITIGGPPGGGGLSRLALLSKYGWYTDKVQEDIKRSYKKRMEKDGGVPKGKYEITLKILLDPQGVIKKYRIVSASGNERLDEALKASLPGLKLSQAPPEGMPALITLKITSQG